MFNHVISVSYNDPPGTAWINAVVAGAQVARFTYSGGRVIAPSRGEVILPRAGFARLYVDVVEWQTRVHDNFLPPLVIEVPCEHLINNMLDRVMLRGTLGTIVFNTVWRKLDDRVILRPCDALDMSWGEFVWFLRIHRVWLAEALAMRV